MRPSRARAALAGFQISMTIYGLVALVLVAWTQQIGVPLLLAFAVVDFILVVIATTAASEGRTFSYPLAIRFLR